MTHMQAERPGPPATRTPGGPLAPTRATPRRQTEDQGKAKQLDPHKVILHNDDHNTMDHVVQALVKSVPSLSQDRATEIMMEAHTNGKAVVVACPLELAELYRDRLQSFGLTATIE
jgi:ATP-dependent Clp protease adaptor protein ClpS